MATLTYSNFGNPGRSYHRARYTVCFIIHVPHFQKSNILICIEQMRAAAPHIKAMVTTFFLSEAFLDWSHILGTVVQYQTQPRHQKRVPSIALNKVYQPFMHKIQLCQICNFLYQSKTRF